MTNALLRIDEKERRPSLVPESAPNGVIVVDSDRIVDLHVFHGPANVGDVLFELELRGTPITTKRWSFVFLGPGADIRQLPPPVDAGVGPEIDQNNLALQSRIRPSVPISKATAIFRAVSCEPSIPLLAQRAECGAELCAEKLRLLPGGKVTAPVHFVEIDQVAIGALRRQRGSPAPRKRDRRFARRQRDWARTPPTPRRRAKPPSGQRLRPPRRDRGSPDD
jgi:hypothetical protein